MASLTSMFKPRSIAMLHKGGFKWAVYKNLMLLIAFELTWQETPIASTS